MLNDEAGRDCRVAPWERYGSRGGAARDPVRILVVDPVLGSRFLLAQALTQPGFLVETASGVGEARSRIARGHHALVLCEQHLGGEDGLAFLAELREQSPETQRALVTAEEGIDFKRRAIEAADLAFVLTKPWSVQSLRATIRDVLHGTRERPGWSRLPLDPVSRLRTEQQAASLRASGRAHDVLVRGLLAGLNSCEFETEVFELVHSELAEPFRLIRWLWIDEESELATRVAGDWPVESGIPLARLSQDEGRRLEQARRSSRITRLDAPEPVTRRAVARSACLGLVIRQAGHRAITGLVWADRARSAELLTLLRELQGGLQMAFGRIREAEARSRAARQLAERVSAELRTPVGALTHAINRLRGEVERAGMPTEWVDRVSSESERVVRAVEHLEGQMLSGQTRAVSTSS